MNPLLASLDQVLAVKRACETDDFTAFVVECDRLRGEMGDQLFWAAANEVTSGLMSIFGDLTPEALGQFEHTLALPAGPERDRRLGEAMVTPGSLGRLARRYVAEQATQALADLRAGKPAAGHQMDNGRPRTLTVGFVLLAILAVLVGVLMGVQAVLP